MAAPKLESSILHATGLEPSALLQEVIQGSHSHICQADGHEYEKEVQAAEAIIANPRALFTDPLPLIFGSSEFLLQWDFSALAEKSALIEALESELKSRSLPGSLIKDVALTTDELFTNALFNAPVEGQGGKSPISRQERAVAMTAGRQGHLTVAADSSRLVVSCTDPYGSLDLKSYLSRIQKNLDAGANITIEDRGGGAGIGSFIVFNLCCSLFVGVWPGRATTVCCIFPLRKSGKQRAALKKHIHCVQL